MTAFSVSFITENSICTLASSSLLSAVGSAMNAMKNKVGIQSSKLYNIRMKAHSAQEYRKEWSKLIKRLS